MKTQRQAANYWLVGRQAREINSETHIYVFINLRGDSRPDYLVVPSAVVAKEVYGDPAKTGSTFYCFDRSTGKEFVVGKGWADQRQEGWEIFGSPS